MLWITRIDGAKGHWPLGGADGDVCHDSLLTDEPQQDSVILKLAD